MKHCLRAFFIFILINHLSAQQRFDIKFILDGRLRECIIVKPSKAPPVDGYPVVFMLHGTAQDGEEFYQESGWKELGEEENFITVFPTSLIWCINNNDHNTKWVNGDLLAHACVGVPQNFVDDINFFKKILSLIKDTVAINTSKVFASGFSNGSVMIHKLAMDAGDVFAAVAGSGGPLALLDSVGLPVYRIPVWFMVGTNDDHYIVPPFTELPFEGDSILSYLQQALNRAVVCQGLTQSFSKKETPTTHTYIWNEAQAGGLSSSPYVFTLIKNMYHIYPSGTNFPISAPKLFWEFFKQTTLVSAKSEEQDVDQVTVYPNPSSATINVHIDNQNLNSTYQFKVLNCFGQVIFGEHDKKETDFELSISKTGAGLFILQIQLGNKIISKKILFE